MSAVPGHRLKFLFWPHSRDLSFTKTSVFLTVPTLVLAGLCSAMACFYVIFFNTDYKRLHAENNSGTLVNGEDTAAATVPEA
nr:PREDICTED: major facilitator superfamily domain-containing protein 7-like [Struthio camelus australis]